MGRRTVFLLFAVLAFWGLARFTHSQTKGFRISKLEGNISCLPLQSAPPLPSEYRALLTQKFHYFGRGIESFSFLSEDGTTVLKLFNNRYQKRLFWLRFLPPLGPLKHWKEEKTAYTQKKWKMAFESYDLAFNFLRNEAGLLFFHPHPTSEDLQTTLIDNLKIQHKLDLSQIAFVLQKRAILAYPYLDSSDPSQAQEAFFSLIALLKKKMDLGIADRDPLIRTNFGFCEGKAMQIDIGPLSRDPSLKNISRQKEEIGKITLSLKHWLENQHPELLPLLNEALQNF